MSQKLKIDFVSDVACPWCAIGLSSLERALEQLGDEVDAQIVMHPFELNPQMDAQGQDTVEYLSKKYGRTAEQIQETQAMIRERGATVGFDFGPRNRVYNTFDAHRLLHWAGLEGKQLELKLALLRAYHSDGKDVSNHDVLAETAQSWDSMPTRRVPSCKAPITPLKCARKKNRRTPWVSSPCLRSSSTISIS